MAKSKSIAAFNNPMVEQGEHKIELSYYRSKDILSIHILPKRPAKTSGGTSDFLIRYDWDDPNTIVGFEILDFFLFIPKIYNREIVPVLPVKFSIMSTEIPGLALQEIQALEPDWQETVIGFITAPPVNQILKISTQPMRQCG